MNRPARVVALHVVAAAIVAACTVHGGKVAPPPNPSLFDSTTVTTVDLSAVSLAGVTGRTTVVVAMGPGQSTLSGAVVDPDGVAVAGATVHVERIEGANEAAMNVTTQADGTWTLPNVLGGQYRVRAWRAPDLAGMQPDVFYLGNTGTHQDVLHLDHFGGTQVSSAIAPNPPIINSPAQLVVQVTTASVGTDGVVRATPMGRASVVLSGSGDWALTRDGAQQLTDSSGTAVWTVVCQSLGAQPLSVVVGGTDIEPLNLPPCAPVPPTTTSTSTSSTTVGSGGSSTTSTTTSSRRTTTTTAR